MFSHEVLTNYNLTMATLQERNRPNIDQASDKRPEINKMNGKDGKFHAEWTTYRNCQEIKINRQETEEEREEVGLGHWVGRRQG